LLDERRARLQALEKMEEAEEPEELKGLRQVRWHPPHIARNKQIIDIK
jgi:hypothetical protein